MPEVIMPRLSDTMEEGELARWLKQVGDQISKGDVLAEIETDKATMDLESFEEGVLEKILVAEGTLVPIGAAVAIIGDGSGSEQAQPRVPAAEKPAAEKPAAEKPAGEAAEPTAGVPALPGGQAPAQKPGASEPVVQAVPAAPAAPAAPQGGRPRTSPLARKIARDNGIDLATLAGSGPQGRIVRADVEAAIAAGGTGVTSAPAAQPVAVERSAPPQTEAERIPLSNIRRVTAKRLTESQAVPHFFLTKSVNVERLVALRAEVNASLAETGTKVSLNDFVVRACALALRAHPEVNSSWGGDSIIRHPQVNVGVAVALEDGLIVPVIRDAGSKSLSQIGRETQALAGKARSGKLSLDEFSGGTFTVSNLGMFGIDQFTAVINPPEAAILAVGAAVPTPVVRDGQLVEVPKMAITLTVDHRVLDGAMAAAFLRDLVGILEAPLRILLG